ncbi:hypothetical protein EDD60_1031, partial [Longibaculum muris]
SFHYHKKALLLLYTRVRGQISFLFSTSHNFTYYPITYLGIAHYTIAYKTHLDESIHHVFLFQSDVHP